MNWSGPAPVHAAKLDTAITLRRLFERAQHRVLIAGYCFDHGKSIFEPLRQAMIERGVQVDFFIHVAIDDTDYSKLKTDGGQQSLEPIFKG